MTIDSVYRDWNTPGVPSSGEHEPIKAEIRRLLKSIAGGTAAVGDYRGAWDAGDDYIATDLVEFGGSIWYAVADSTNVTPVEGASWTMFLPGVSVADGSITDAKLTNDAAGLRAIRGKIGMPRYIDVEQFGPVSDDADRGAAFEAAVAYMTANNIAGAVVTAPPGVYAMTEGTSLPSGNEWLMDGVVLDYGGVAAVDLVTTLQTGKGCLVGQGAGRTSIPDLAANVTKGTHILNFGAAHGRSPNDIIEIYDPTNSSLSPANTIFRKGQTCRVMVVVDSDTLWIDEPLNFDFVAATVDVYSIDTWTGKIRGVEVRGPGLSNSYVVGVSLDFTNNAVLENVSVTGGVDYTGVGIGRSIDTVLDHCMVAEDGVNDNGNDYGLGIYSSSRVRVRDSYFTAARHGVTHGTLSGYGPYYKTLFEDCVGISKETVNGIAGWDYHGGGYDCTAIRCNMRKGLVISGGSLTLIDCIMENSKPYGFAITVSQPFGGTYRLIRPRFEIGGITSGSFSVFYFGDGPQPASCLTQDAVFYLENVTVRGNVASQSTFMALWSDNTTYKVDVEINGYDDDNTTSRNRILSCTRDTTPPIAPNYLAVHNVKRAAASIDAILLNTAYPTPTKTIEQVW